jgi:hypothetical protein
MCESIVFQLHFDSSSDIIKLVPGKNIIYSFEKQWLTTLKKIKKAAEPFLATFYPMAKTPKQ